MKKFIIIVVSILFLNSCVPPRLELSKEEKLFQSTLSKELNCDIEIRHNYPAIEKGDTMAGLGIFMCDSMCELDDGKLLPICKGITQKIAPILSHKDNYKYISFGFSKGTQINDRLSVENCLKTIYILISNPDSVILQRALYR